MGTLLNYGDIMATELSTDYDVTAPCAQGGTMSSPCSRNRGMRATVKFVLTIDSKTLYPEKAAALLPVRAAAQGVRPYAHQA